MVSESLQRSHWIVKLTVRTKTKYLLQESLVQAVKEFFLVKQKLNKKPLSSQFCSLMLNGMLCLISMIKLGTEAHQCQGVEVPQLSGLSWDVER